MSAENEDIKKQFEDFSSRFGPKTIVPGRVTAVNNDDTVAVEFSDGSSVDDCRLKSVVKSGNKVILIPGVDSIVLVARIENSEEYVVVAVDEISKMLSVIGNVRQEIDEDGFVFEKGGNTMWDAVKLLIEALEKAVILQGKNIDRVKLTQAKTMFKDLLNGT